MRGLGLQSTSRSDDDEKLAVLRATMTKWLESTRSPALVKAARIATAALEHSSRWLREAANAGPDMLEAGARRFAITIGRAVELALLVRHAQWSEDHEQDYHATTAAQRFAHSGVDLIIDLEV